MSRSGTVFSLSLITWNFNAHLIWRLESNESDSGHGQSHSRTGHKDPAPPGQVLDVDGECGAEEGTRIRSGAHGAKHGAQLGLGVPSAQDLGAGRPNWSLEKEVS